MKLVELESMQMVEKALERYCHEVGKSMYRMLELTEECHTNMGSDIISGVYLKNLLEYLQCLRNSVKTAETLRVKMHDTVIKIQMLDGMTDESDEGTSEEPKSPYQKTKRRL